MEERKFSKKTHKKFLKYDSETEICSLKEECVFCNIYHNDKAKIEIEHPNCFVMKDRSPGGREHWLVIPKRHIRHIYQFKKEDYGLLLEMKQAGIDYMTSKGYTLD